MPDVVDPATRSRMMAGIRGKNTKPELAVRSALHRLGFRFRIHPPNLPGKPDLAFPGRRAVILVHGCFWHGHDCHLFKWPSTRKEFWHTKINRNRAKDAETDAKLAGEGWRRLAIWECALKGRTKLPFEDVVSAASAWLKSGTGDLELEGLR